MLEVNIRVESGYVCVSDHIIDHEEHEGHEETGQGEKYQQNKLLFNGFFIGIFKLPFPT